MTRFLLLALMGLLLVPDALAQRRAAIGSATLQSAVERERQPGFQVGSAATRGISGRAGDGAITLEPGGENILYGVVMGERSDAPCFLEAYFWNKPTPQSEWGWASEKIDGCGSRGPRRASNKYVGIGDSNPRRTSYWQAGRVSPFLGDVVHAATGVQLCDNDRNQNNIRMKGLRLFGASLDQDQSRQVRRDNALTNDEDRTNCRRWRTQSMCPGNQVMVGLVVQVRLDGYDPDSIVGVAPKCAPVTIRAAQVPVATD